MDMDLRQGGDFWGTSGQGGPVSALQQNAQPLHVDERHGTGNWPPKPMQNPQPV